MKKIFFSLFILLPLLLLPSCNPSPQSGFIGIDNTWFIDPAGREILFHGVNVICKDPRKNYLTQLTQAELEDLASYGFNVIRLGIIWSGIEPEPGLYDEKYLLQIDQLVNWATDAGLYVLLDMHQDLYGQKFSDGAPDWASLDQGLPHFHGAVWSDSYMISPAVQACFDNFWDNALAPDELGVQDHYVNMWKMLAERYKDDQGIIGFDLMNEPFMGSQAQQVMPLMIQAYAHQLMDMESAWKEGSLEDKMQELAARWADEHERLEILRTLENPSLYAPVIESSGPLCQTFESDILNPFYQKLRDSIRAVNAYHILFLEHNYFANTGIPSAIEIPLNENGEKDPLVAYAAHGYDLVTDTKEVGSPSSARVDFIFRRIKKKADELNVPLLVGEWGAYGGDHPIYAETSAFIMSLFEEFGCSHTYWNYGGKDFAQKAYFPVLTRAFPIEVSAYPGK
ncbi:MAG: cellulase family glycosylhydrolase [Bacteroidota bacterium]|nr:cellulase family glycosylhydrolase [Bacteroidota bacterium]